MRLSRVKGTIIVLSVTIAAMCGIAVHIRAGEGRPTVRLIYSNDLVGTIDPCGCGGRRLGGLAKRKTFVSELLKTSPNTIILDSGNLSNMADKLDFIDSILASLHYDAIGIGASDVSLYRDEYYQQAFKHKLNILDHLPSARKGTIPYLLKKINGVTVGVVSTGAIPQDVHIGDMEVRKADMATMRKVRGECDIFILLDQRGVVTKDWLDNSARSYGQPDIVIGGVAKRSSLKETVVGSTHIMPIGSQGNNIGVVDIDKSDDGKFTISPKLVLLDETVKEDEIIAKQAKDLMDGIRESHTAVATSKSPANAKPYYSPVQCKTCHPRVYDDWVKTDHAKAIKTLISANRVLRECIVCHSENFRATGSMNVSSSGPSGVECATCHINVLPHSAANPPKHEKAKVDLALCVKCHTRDRSPDYNQRSYLPKVSHKQ